MSYFDEVVSAISSLPGIGKRSAMRIAFHLLKRKTSSFYSFIKILDNFYQSTKFCEICGAMVFEDNKCTFCNSHKREYNTICIVEQPSDIFYIEQSGSYHGQYHVLMGVLDPMNGIYPENLRIQELKSRITLSLKDINEKQQKIEEIIIATNPSIEGDATAQYIKVLLEEPQYPLKISRIATGMTKGSQLDFTDANVISHSMQFRTIL